MSVLEQDITRTEWVEKLLESDVDNDNNQEYKLEAIQNCAIYANILESSHVSGLYYFLA